MSIGSGLAHLEQFTSAMEIPCMTNRTYTDYHNKVCDGWEHKCLDVMRSAAEEEKALALEAGEVDEDNMPMITVICD